MFTTCLIPDKGIFLLRMFADENNGVSVMMLAELCPVESQKFLISCHL
jgi:hypothetical protein